jgi:DNA-binding PadR family transcriptional regulator
MKLSATGRVILGMISQGHRTGYDIKRIVDKSTRFFWAASYGQIYPELRLLEEAGLIAGEPSPSGGRQRNAYSLTAAGEDALLEWLRSPGELGYELRDEALLRIFFADGLEDGELIDLLRRMRERSERALEQLEAIKPSAEAAGAGTALVSLDYGLHLQRATIEWCRQAEERIATGRTAAAGRS